MQIRCIFDHLPNREKWLPKDHRTQGELHFSLGNRLVFQFSHVLPSPSVRPVFMMKSVLFPCFPKFLKISIEDTGIESIEDHGIAIQSVGGFINISGLGNSEKVDFFGIDGNALGSARSIYGSVSFPARQGTVVVARIGKESVKVAVE